MSNSLEERLKTHSTAFDGLLSLIPAKYYYDEATLDQWQRKKKAKNETSEVRQAKKAKLDPDSVTTADSYNTHVASAKDIMDNRAKTAKKVTLPQKHANPQPDDNDNDKSSGIKNNNDASPKDSEELISKGPQLIFDDEGNEQSLEGEASNAPIEQEKLKKKSVSPEDQKLREKRREELKEKLANKINLLREKRKAPGTKAGGAAKSREQMLAERKRKEELRKQEKLKRKREAMENDDESEKSDEDEDEDGKEDGEAKVLFGNIQFADGSRMTSDLKSIRKGIDHKKRKGPANKDIKAHLNKLDIKKRKLDQLTPEQRKETEEKSQWSSLMNQAEGIKVKDDEKLLIKALKRKEKQKLKSEIEWKERKQVVKDTISERQKRRESNLKARRENKGKKSKNQTKLRKFTGIVQKGKGSPGGKDGKKRAGFEGNAKSKGKQKK